METYCNSGTKLVIVYLTDTVKNHFIACNIVISIDNHKINDKLLSSNNDSITCLHIE